MERLKKCPICGGKLTIYDWRHRLVKVSEELEKADVYDAQCDCGFGFILPERPLKEFIERLNTRKPIEQVVERVENLKEQCITCITLEKQLSNCDSKALIAMSNQEYAYGQAIEIVKEEM